MLRLKNQEKQLFNLISSLVSTSTPEEAVKALTIGKKERVAKAGASSVIVYIIFGEFDIKTVCMLVNF